MEDSEERLNRLLARLEKSLADFERVVEMMTTLPILPEVPQAPDFPMPNQSMVCQKCNMDLSGVMGYVCPNVDCPVGLSGATFSSMEGTSSTT